ncbi:hypothetical protein ASPZODRAFT_97843 [Penicilliopsis zonata CBS 506.65]|uniref:Uncharacterized protein n=1 Tax=Penicilliopsis zonata CBS 506.65 TaxID=1073090 RepID=A0A1L9SGK7_9EURO|nr:hypothetical protein ASPZODRAFT_97843 [Penicilliopsis zonata CBS 506.65]OJJ46184.1 hypothetical protein ASPZODRAFT_97843 [Penicilliopsis zonata CBS 506.65]
MDAAAQKPSQLQVPPVPKFPFSSPISEEISSPSGSSDGRDSDRDNEAGLRPGPGHNPLLPEGSDSGQQTLATSGLRGIMKRNTERPVGLNLVTNFGATTSASNANTVAPPPTFVDLNDLKELSKTREKERTMQRMKSVFRKKATQGSRGVPDETGGGDNRKRTSYSEVLQNRLSPGQGRPGDELSPSDRFVVIGISVDTKSRDDYKTTRELESAGSQGTPVTPSIVITPARNDPLWRDNNNAYSGDLRGPRVASSVYSQPTPYLGTAESEAPPVPAIPAFHFMPKNKNRQSIASLTRKQRAFSTGTVFEEDFSPLSARRSRSYSNDSNIKNLDNLSVNLPEADGHLSQGWWNYHLLSPLLSRSDTRASGMTVPSPKRATIPPSVTTDTTGATDNWWDREISAFSPDTPETAIERRKSLAWQNAEAPAVPPIMPFMFPGNAIEGSAAEYYQACAHELFSGKPYFECVNHVCSITPAEKIAALLEASSAGERGIARSETGAPKLTTEVPQSPLLDFDSCSDSGSSNCSIIEDAEEDAAEEEEKPQEISKAIPEEEEETSIPLVCEKKSTNPFEPGYSNPLPKEPAVETRPPEPTNISYVIHNHYAAPAVPDSYPFAQTERGIYHYTTTMGVPPQAPDPVSPGYQQVLEGTGSIPLKEMPAVVDPKGHEMEYNSLDDQPHNPHPEYQRELPQVPVSDLPYVQREKVETRRRRLEREDAAGRKCGGCWRGRGPISKRGCFGRPGREGRLRRRWYIAIALFFLAIVVVAVVLATTLTRKSDDTPVQSEWLNLTGYPPMPTGIMTIAGTEPQVQDSGCIVPSTLWQCALPKAQQAANEPYSANEPNFRVEIRFRNGTYPNSTTVASKRDDSSDSFDPSPSPPPLAEQRFLGNTTDGNSKPYAGEETPFYITFLSTDTDSDSDSSTSTRKLRRSDSSSTINFTFPTPAENSDGTAAAATLYPLPESQPVRLYNRGKSTEHYGFYNYFGRSIFLESMSPFDANDTDTVANDQDGGCTEAEARVRCTWSETRFLVQIWTRPGSAGMELLSGTSTTTTTASAATSTASSSATDFDRPGSFPYPVSITLDRHGGVNSEKMVYCYGIETDQHYNLTMRTLEVEDRSYGGTLIDPAPGPANDSVTVAPDGGWDGGTGGCKCLWTNWESVS